MYKTLILVIQCSHYFNLIYEQPFKFKIRCHKKNWNVVVLSFFTCKCKLTFITFVVLTQKSIKFGCLGTCTIKVHNQYFIVIKYKIKQPNNIIFLCTKIIYAWNNMGVEFEYLYSLHPKIKNFYNFTQSSRIRLW
jgi:hypothetical protein